jgi:hypothetical protein
VFVVVASWPRRKLRRGSWRRWRRHRWCRSCDRGGRCRRAWSPIAEEQAPVVAYWSSDDHAPPYPATGLTPPPRRILPLLDGFDRGGSHGQARRLQQLGQRPQWPQLSKRTGRRGGTIAIDQLLTNWSAGGELCQDWRDSRRPS